jgi:hypothetical protein
MVALRAFGVWFMACVATGCGGDSESDDGGASSGGTSSVAGSSNVGGGSSGGANSGGSSTGGTSAGGTSAGGTSAGGTSAGGTSAGGSGGGPAPETGPGTVTDLWRDFCVATFTENYSVVDAFGDPLFEIQAGEEYLLLDYPEPYRSAEAAYLTSSGPVEFDIEPNADNTAFPFTSNCAYDPPVPYFAVFADVSVFAEPALTTKLCDLTEGTALPRDEGSSAGFALESVNAGVSVYEVFLNAFSAQCEGAATGYIGVPAFQLFGTNYVRVPFRSLSAEQ